MATGGREAEPQQQTPPRMLPTREASAVRVGKAALMRCTMPLSTPVPAAIRRYRARPSLRRLICGAPPGFDPRLAEPPSPSLGAGEDGTDARFGESRPQPVQERTNLIRKGRSHFDLGCVKTLEAGVSTQKRNRTCSLGESFMRGWLALRINLAPAWPAEWFSHNQDPYRKCRPIDSSMRC